MAEDKVVDKVEDQESQLSDIEKQAVESGWKPKDKFEGDEEDFVSAKEFIKRGELIAQIEAEKQRTKQVTGVFNALKDHHAKVYESARKQVEAQFKDQIKELRAQKQTALEEGETATALILNDKIDAAKEQLQERLAQVKEVPAPQVPNNEPHPIYVEWAAKNKWYNKDQEATELANEIAAGQTKMHGDPKSPEEFKAVLDYVAKRVKELKPDKFVKPAVSAVDDGGGSGNGRSNPDSKMTDEEEKVFKTFVESGVKGSNGKIITRSEYIKQVRG